MTHPSILTTTIAALFLQGAASLVIGGSEMKESKTTQDPDMFRTGEIQFDVFGEGGFGHDEHIVTDTHTETDTQKITVITFQNRRIEGHHHRTGDPFIDPLLREKDRREAHLIRVPVTTTRTVTTTKKVRTTRNDAALQGAFGGGGLDAKYFVTRNVGLGVEGAGLDGDDSFGTVKGTVTVRFPMGSTAPYLMGGAGVQYGDRTQAIGSVGAGVEHRFSPETGIFLDGNWMFADHEDAAVFRLGMSLIR